jgi:hypothetical protein
MPASNFFGIVKHPAGIAAKQKNISHSLAENSLEAGPAAKR